jgi:hypothetical protein
MHYVEAVLVHTRFCLGSRTSDDAVATATSACGCAYGAARLTGPLHQVAALPTATYPNYGDKFRVSLYDKHSTIGCHPTLVLRYEGKLYFLTQCCHVLLHLTA